jgi:hypothetical protein
MEEPVQYVPTDPSELAATQHTSSPVQRAVRSLQTVAGRRAWPARALPTTPAPPVLPDAARDEDDPLVGLLAQLRGAITRYVFQLRAEGARPEQVLVQVKAHVREAMVAERWLDPRATKTLTGAVVRWSIDAYYDRTPGP